METTRHKKGLQEWLSESISSTSESISNNPGNMRLEEQCPTQLICERLLCEGEPPLLGTPSSSPERLPAGQL